MRNFKLIDVSLRDGGHRVNFEFTEQALKKILQGLDNSGVEYIEVGYKNGLLTKFQHIGPAGLCQNPYLAFCRKLISQAKLAVMAHPQNITPEDIIAMKRVGVDLVRICVNKNNLKTIQPLVNTLKEKDLEFSINVTHVSQYTQQQIDDLINTINSFNPNLLYFADSNGNLLPEQVFSFYKRLVNNHCYSLGFHGHDNIGLAQANTLRALDAGVKYIDASLAGMGKGIGNMKIEYFIAYLQAAGIKKYPLKFIYQAADFVRKSLNIENNAVTLGEFTRGIKNLSTAELKILEKKSLSQHMDIVI